MGRWQIYELLKKGSITESEIKEIEQMDGKEVKEGVIEYLIMKGRDKVES